MKKAYEVHTNKAMRAAVKANPGCYFSTITTPASTLLLVEAEPTNENFTAARILSGITKGQYF